jgi:hypothetical protein
MSTLHPEPPLGTPDAKVVVLLFSHTAHASLRRKMAAASKSDGPAVGIDLGTTYSCVAVWRHDRGEVIANDQGNRLTPSCVAFTSTERLVGEAAVNQAALNPMNTVFGEYYSPVFLPSVASISVVVRRLFCW